MRAATAAMAGAVRQGLRHQMRRAGWAGGLGGGLMVAALAGGLLLDRHVEGARADLARERARLMRAELAAREGPADSDRARLERFYARRFPGESELPARLGKLYAAAEKHGIAIRRVDYRMVAEPATPLQRVALVLPVQGDFPRIHGWLSAVLVELPELALEGLSIRRTGSEASTLEAEIRLAILVGAGR